MSDDSDPQIVNRLKNLPPYNNEEVETPITAEETPTETIEKSDVETPEVNEETPDNIKQRTTEQFEKLKQSNNNLKAEVETLKKKNVLDSLIPEPLPQVQMPPLPQPNDFLTTNIIPNVQQYLGLSQKQIKDTYEGLVDDNGYVDTGLLKSTLSDLKEQNRLANERARLAEQESKNVVKKFDDFERNAIMVKVHDKFPNLDPNNSNFDEKLWKFVRNEVVDQWMNGKQTDVMAAAQEGYDTLYGESMKKEDKIKKEQAEMAKKNINALGSSQTSQRDSYSDHDALVKATQLGRKGALAERLRKANQ